jgi:hypothetical protein
MGKPDIDATKALLAEYRAERYAEDGLELAEHVPALVAEVERLRSGRAGVASAVRALLDLMVSHDEGEVLDMVGDPHRTSLVSLLDEDGR